MDVPGTNLRTAEDELKAVLNSTSWKITAPLRKAVAFLRGETLRQPQIEFAQPEPIVEVVEVVSLEASAFIDTNAAVLQYRRAHFEVHGKVAPGLALPTTHAWPEPDTPGLSYKDKLTKHLKLTGKGVEIGPLNFPLLSKEECNVYFVDHLDTAGLQTKYKELTDIVPVDLPMVDDNLKTTLKPIAPIDISSAPRSWNTFRIPSGGSMRLLRVWMLAGWCRCPFPTVA